MATIGFTVDALHIIEMVAEEADAPGIIIGLELIHGLLQKVAKRAVELDDPEMLGYMEKLHLVEKTVLYSEVEVKAKEGGAA